MAATSRVVRGGRPRGWRRSDLGAHDRHVKLRGLVYAPHERRRGRSHSALVSALLAVLVAGCVPATRAPLAEPTPSTSPFATSTPIMTRLASPQPSWPTKAPPGTTPEPVPPGSLLPGEDVLAIEEFDDPSIFGGPGRVTLRHAVAVGSGFVVLGDV
jgi:hypothetical protein